MPLSYNEYYHKRTGLTVGVEKLLFSEQTPYQLVEVYETDTWGNLMTIDGMVMLSEKDEFVYHEMLAHVAMFSHPDPRRVLIIGGGDGGTAREVLRHPVQQVDMVEIDEAVVRASKEHLPGVGDWNNPKLNVLFEDGIQFVQQVDEPYDVIIIDGSDPVGPAEGLFEKEFIRACHQALADGGVMTAQTESPWVEEYHSSMRKIFGALDQTYDVSRMYLAWIPLYPGGMWSFAFASKGVDPLSDEVSKRVEKGMKGMGDRFLYYNREIHAGSFALPGFVRDILG